LNVGNETFLTSHDTTYLLPFEYFHKLLTTTTKYNTLYFAC